MAQCGCADPALRAFMPCMWNKQFSETGKAVRGIVCIHRWSQRWRWPRSHGWWFSAHPSSRLPGGASCVGRGVPQWAGLAFSPLCVPQCPLCHFSWLWAHLSCHPPTELTPGDLFLRHGVCLLSSIHTS